MGKAGRRDLSIQEFVMLGLMSVEPQSGYTVINYFEDGVYRWSASPGSVYPMLKRMEKDEIIAGELEMIHETRPRKMYSLTALGGQMLDDWLREPPEMPPLAERREVAMLKFLFMEGRLSHEEILKWLDNYQASVDMYDYGRRVFRDTTLAAMSEYNISSIHRQLVLEATIMEVNAHRTWIQMARTRLMMARATGEHKAVKGDG